MRNWPFSSDILLVAPPPQGVSKESGKVVWLLSLAAPQNPSHAPMFVVAPFMPDAFWPSFRLVELDPVTLALADYAQYATNLNAIPSEVCPPMRNAGVPGLVQPQGGVLGPCWSIPSPTVCAREGRLSGQCANSNPDSALVGGQIRLYFSRVPPPSGLVKKRPGWRWSGRTPIPCLGKGGPVPPRSF